MLEDPGLDVAELRAALRDSYGVEADRLTFVRGHDMSAAAYRVDSAHFLKVRFGPAPAEPVEVPRALLDAGIGNVLAPIRTRAGALLHHFGDNASLVLCPFVPGRNAMEAGMTGDQWGTYGAALRAVHDSGLEARFAELLPAETFELPSAAVLREVLAAAPAVRSLAASRMAAFLAAQADRIGAMLGRAEELGARLRHRSFARVLCHADIHPANILVADDGRILLVDWDGPMIAPRERDLLFVIGSRIARRVEPQEEAWFFDGYGPVPVDHEAIVYYRYERIIEDIGVDAAAVMTDPALPESSRESATALVESFFEPGADIDAAERIDGR